MEFVENKEGINKLIVKTRTGQEEWIRSDKTIVTDLDVKVDEKVLEKYAGTYEVNPQFSFTILKEKNRLFLEAAGQGKMEMFAESDTKFYLKVNDAQFEFVMVSGKVTKLILKQGGRTTDAVKTK
jgi:CTP synthase (UTP-ammonia lyase)